MIGTTHLAAGLCAGIIFASSPIGLAGILFGSRFPDQIDFFIAGRNRQLFEKIHRRTSHNLFWWVIGFVLFLFLSSYIFPSYFIDFTAWFIIGGLLHLFLDSLTKSGIPFIPFKREKIGFRFCYTKGAFDYSLCLFFIIISVYFLFAQGRLEHFKNGFFSFFS